MGSPAGAPPDLWQPGRARLALSPLTTRHACPCPFSCPLVRCCQCRRRCVLVGVQRGEVRIRGNASRCAEGPGRSRPLNHYSPTLMTAPDIHAITARKVHNLPDNWEPVVYGCLDRGLGYYLIGAVPVGTFSRGSRKGRPKFPPKNQLQRVVITAAEKKQAQMEWENTTGLCSCCGGSGKQVKSISITEGATYRDCVACNGTGKPLHLRGQSTTTHPRGA